MAQHMRYFQVAIYIQAANNLTLYSRGLPKITNNLSNMYRGSATCTHTQVHVLCTESHFVRLSIKDTCQSNSFLMLNLTVLSKADVDLMYITQLEVPLCDE